MRALVVRAEEEGKSGLQDSAGWKEQRLVLGQKSLGVGGREGLGLQMRELRLPAMERASSVFIHGVQKRKTKVR